MRSITAPREWNPSLDQSRGRAIACERALLQSPNTWKSHARVLYPPVRRTSTIGSESLVGVMPHQGSKVVSPLHDTLQAISRFTGLPENWDGEDSLPPTPHAIIQATVWVADLYARIACEGGQWLAPYVSDSADGGVMLEWWHRHKKLTVYIWSDRSEFVQVWGADIRNEMAEGTADPIDAFMSVWSWLTR